MDLSVYIRFIVALIFVLSLIGLIYWCVQRFGLKRLLGDTIAGGRIKIIETKRINTKFQLVLIKRDTATHLLLLGTDNGVLIETLNDIEKQEADGENISKKITLNELSEKNNR
tara:strand:- start:209 stop:547 length:339 start_codon:yes stop_codon:yes gene_type:complete